MPYLDLSPNSRAPISGRARIIHRPRGPLPPSNGVTLVSPHAWATVVNPSTELAELAQLHPLGLLVHATVDHLRAGPRGHLAARVGDRVSIIGRPGAATGPVTERLMATDDVSARLGRMEARGLRALCIDLVSRWGRDARVLLPDAAATSPFDYPGGWSERALHLLDTLARYQSHDPLPPDAYAVAQAAALLSDRPSIAVPDDVRQAGRAASLAPGAARAVSEITRENPRVALVHRLVQVMAALLHDGDPGQEAMDGPASRLREAIRSATRTWEPIRARITVVAANPTR